MRRSNQEFYQADPAGHLTQQEEWFGRTVPAFLEAHGMYRTTPVLLGALDYAVKELQTAQPRNAFDPSILVQADAIVRQQLNLATTKTN